MRSTGRVIYSLTYVSSAVRAFTADELQRLLAGSRQRNERDSISGMLLYKDGNFMQVLEGDESVVRATHARIASDARHSGLITLLQGTVSERAFAAWSMAFRDLNALGGRVVEGYDDFLNTPLTDERFKRDPSASQRLLQVFKTRM